MERIERIDRRDGIEPVRLTLLSPAERERDRQERERRRRSRRGPSGKPDGDATHRPATDAPAPRLDLRA